MGTHDHIVYIYDEHDNEIEVDMELLEDGYPYGLLTVNGTEIRLSSEQEQKARDQHRENMEEYAAQQGEYYSDY